MNTCRIIRLTVLFILLLLAGLPLSAQEDAPYRADSLEMAKLRAVTQYMYRVFQLVKEPESRDTLEVVTNKSLRWQPDNDRLDTLKMAADTVSATAAFRYGWVDDYDQPVPRLTGRTPYRNSLKHFNTGGLPKIEIGPAVFTLNDGSTVSADSKVRYTNWTSTGGYIAYANKERFVNFSTLNPAFPDAPPVEDIKSARLTFTISGQTGSQFRRLTAANEGETFMLNGFRLKLLTFTPDYAVLETLSGPEGKRWGTKCLDDQDLRWKYSGWGFHIGRTSLNNQGGSGELFLQLLREEPDISQEDFCNRMEEVILAAAIRGNAGEAPTANDKRKFRIAYSLGEMSSLIVYSDVEEVLVEKTLELDLTQPDK